MIVWGFWNRSRGGFFTENARRTFGTSAYLKLLGHNPKSRDTEIRKRLSPSKGGYDYHKAMRKIVTEHASGAANYEVTQRRLDSINSASERNSAKTAIRTFMEWLGDREVRLTDSSGEVKSSPNEVFSVRFTPDFEMDLDGLTTHIHIWNTIRPAIRIREAIGTLGLFVSDDHPRSIGILSLRSGELFLPADATSSRELARLMALDIEKRFIRAIEDRRDENRQDISAEKRATG